jgi:hypothetical protein
LEEPCIKSNLKNIMKLIINSGRQNPVTTPDRWYDLHLPPVSGHDDGDTDDVRDGDGCLEEGLGLRV